jgi:hypothetical protein
MKLNSHAFVLSLFFVSIYGQNLIDVLNANGFTNFAFGLQGSPGLLQRFNGRNDITVWAPLNDAFQTSQPFKPVQKSCSAAASKP